MLLDQLLNMSRDSADIAGKVFHHAEIGDLLLEATAKVLRFNYERAKTDPKPRVLVLGRWLHPRTNNKLVAGLNLNYLNDEEANQLSHYLPQIMKPNSLKVRWWTGYGLLPQIWLKSYRQYDERFIHSMGQADIDPEPKDYETPKQPGEPEKISPKAAAQIQKLKELEAQRLQQPPHEPKKREITRFTKDTIKRIYNLIKKRLFRNKKKEQAKKEIEPIEPKLDIEEPENEVEADALKDIEDEYRASEGKMNGLDTLIEATVKDRNLTWNSTANYVYWHSPEKFTEYQPKLRGCVLDYAQGTKLIAIYDVIADKLIVDLADSPQILLAESGWDWNTTIRIVVDENGLNIDYNVIGENVFSERVKKHDFWGVIQELAADLQ